LEFFPFGPAAKIMDPPSGMVDSQDMGRSLLVLNGAQMGFQNSPMGPDCIAVFRAQDMKKGQESMRIIVERGMEGFSTPETHANQVIGELLCTVPRTSF